MDTISKPIILIAHTRACSTAFERVLMTRRDLLRCLNEPFADPFYCGPEALSERHRVHGKNVTWDGFGDCTYESRVSLIERENVAEEGKRAFFKDMAFQIMKPNDETPELAPSFGSPPDAEPDNPTALPLEVLRKFRWTFIIRHPRSGIPSLYRLSMPSQREATGWDYFLPSEAGYKELRKLFDFLLSRHVIDRASICLVDADDLLAQPEKITEAYCRSIDVDYKPEMLRWDTDEDDAHVREVFAAPQWQAFHYDAMTSRGLHARKADHTPKSAAELHQSWITEFGTEGAAIIRDTVNANMPDYEYLKSFAMRV